MRKLSLVATMILLSCTCISAVISHVHFNSPNVSAIKAPTIMSYSQNSTAIARIYIAHSSVSDLTVDLGVGDPVKPYWSINAWNRESGMNNLNLSVSISAAQFLPPSEENRWFLRVFDAAYGNQGEIEKFTIITDNQTFDSMSVPVAIHDFQISYSYIPGVPFELTVSRRISIRDFPDTDNFTSPEVSWDLLSKVLWAGYGLSTWGRTLPNICGDFPLVIYVCNRTAVYKYDPEGQSLSVWKYGDYRFSVEPYPGFPYPGLGAHPAPIELFIALDTSKSADINLGAMEAGAAIQNIYLEANTLGLGTVCVGGVNATLSHEILNLPTSEVILYNMPLGHPAQFAFYNFTCASSPESPELPQVKESSVFLDYTLEEHRTSHEWSNVSLSQQDTSQILWAAYGRSYLMDMRPDFWSFEYQHRTVPSAGYCLTIYLVNSTGVYLYDPWTHRIFAESISDETHQVSQATEANWVASAPMILLIVLNTSQAGEGQMDFAYTEMGCVIENVHLESIAQGLVADWAMINDEPAIKSILGITDRADLRPICVLTVGHPLEYGHKVQRSGNSYLVSVSTNSTITNFHFDALTNKESYEVEGANNTVGYSNVTIPRSLLNGNFKVEVDGITTIYSLRQNSTDSILYFTYNHSSHRVEISAVDNIPPEIYAPLQMPIATNVSVGQDVTVLVNVTDLESGVRGVILSYCVDSDATWMNITMQLNSTLGLYEGGIPEQPLGTWVRYEIVAYDNANNVVIEDKAGGYYTYHVIPEFTTWAFCYAILLCTTVVLILLKRRRIIMNEGKGRQQRRVQ